MHKFQFNGYKLLNTMVVVSAVSVFFTGCASTPEYVKNIKPENYLYSNTVKIDLTKSLEDISLSVGNDKTGFISPDRSTERINFERNYPIKQHSSESLEALNGITYNHRVGQVLRLSADLDKRTSGFLKSEKGDAVSVSGMIQITSEPAISSALATGGSQVVATSVSSGSAINPAQGAGYNIGAGLGLGFIAGGIHALQADAAKNGIISKEDYGSRMEETTFSFAIPSAGRLTLDGYGRRGRAEPVLVSDGIVKVIFTVDGGKTIDYKNKIFLLSTVGTYRGEVYRKKYPQTEGWEFRITNMNVIAIPDLNTPEKRYLELRKALLENNVKL
ncbi:hypothetical protein [Limnohabitans sp. INBF002]|uniref:hypothetical protein n=1 Tax=Limnohabitans sp. INBF002 TaxID=2986280 RepID=UPI00249237C6|nr:hypothetical protein [Limnohabitans sp. INBF002]